MRATIYLIKPNLFISFCNFQTYLKPDFCSLQFLLFFLFDQNNIPVFVCKYQPFDPFALYVAAFWELYGILLKAVSNQIFSVKYFDKQICKTWQLVLKNLLDSSADFWLFDNYKKIPFNTHYQWLQLRANSDLLWWHFALVNMPLTWRLCGRHLSPISREKSQHRRFIKRNV